MALDLPEEARRRLAAWRDEAIAGREDLRPVRPEALHVTLAFLGWRAEKEVERIAETMSRAVEGLACPGLAPSAVKAVPRRAPRLFALDLDDEGGRAAAVQSGVEGALAARGFHEPEARPWWPHLTLARVKRGRRASPLEAPPPPPVLFRALEVTLYRSTLRPQGAVYEPLARTSLSPG